MAEKRRKAIIDTLSVHREFIAAGIRSPELVDRTLQMLPREHRGVLRRFMVDFSVILAAEKQAADRAPSPASPKLVSSPLSGALTAASAFRAAIVGVSASPPDPLVGIESFINVPLNRPGLIHGDAAPINTFLDSWPQLERFLVRELLDIDDDDRAFFSGDSSERIGEIVETSSPVAPRDNDVVTGSHELISVNDAFAQASMLWTQTHPIDLAALARDRAALIGQEPNPSRFDDIQTIILRRNLELHFPAEEWEMLLLSRDAARQELGVLGEELVGEGADVSSVETDVAVRGRLYIALNNCRDGLINLGISSSPEKVRELIVLRLTHLLSDVTSVAHESGFVLSAAGVEPAQQPLDAAPLKQTLSQKFQKLKKEMQSSSKKDAQTSAESRLVDVGRRAFAITQVAKKHIRFTLSAAANGIHPDDSTHPDGVEEGRIDEKKIDGAMTIDA